MREGWVDFVGLGRMVLSYPEFLWDACHGRAIQRKRGLQNLQRLHDGTAKRTAFRLLSARRLLQTFRFAAQLKAAKNR